MTKSAKRLGDIQASIFARMTQLANEKKAINLAQGFPDFDGPRELIDRIHFNLDDCANQYTRSSGHPALCKALNKLAGQTLPRSYDPVDEITVVNGATEGILCTIVGLVDPGKKILVFEPYYESYLACAKIAGADLVGVPLLPPEQENAHNAGVWHVDWEAFDKALDNDLGLILLNHPHNPTGKVFTKEELERIYGAAKKLGIAVVIDGVYENLVYPPFQKDFLPFLAAHSEDTIFISAISKTLSFTGFKIGWVFAPKAYMRAIRAVHEAAVYCQPPHLQLAVADILSDQVFYQAYVARFKVEFLEKRDMARRVLIDFGFHVPNTQGTYFLMAKKHKAPLNATVDQGMAFELLDNYKIATIPVSGFYVGPVVLSDWLRFAFCKKPQTLALFRTALTLR